MLDGLRCILYSSWHQSDTYKGVPGRVLGLRTSDNGPHLAGPISGLHGRVSMGRAGPVFRQDSLHLSFDRCISYDPAFSIPALSVDLTQLLFVSVPQNSYALTLNFLANDATVFPTANKPLQFHNILTRNSQTCDRREFPIVVPLKIEHWRCCLSYGYPWPLQTCQVSRISRETHAFSMSLTLSLRTVKISRIFLLNEKQYFLMSQVFSFCGEKLEYT